MLKTVIHFFSVNISIFLLRLNMRFTYLIPHSNTIRRKVVLAKTRGTDPITQGFQPCLPLVWLTTSQPINRNVTTDACFGSIKLHTNSATDPDPRN